MSAPDVTPPPPIDARRLDDIDWTRWTARDLATLVFIVQDDRVLLIRKKRGLGAGKINGPGGRMDPGETPVDCARREVQEELLATPTGLVPCGELRFQFLNGYSIHVHVFRATGCDGEPSETPEATPCWTHTDRIPYERMWADDRIWLPLLLAGRRFDGRFIFDGDTMIDHAIVEVAPDPAPGEGASGLRPGSTSRAAERQHHCAEEQHAETPPQVDVDAK